MANDESESSAKKVLPPGTRMAIAITLLGVIVIGAMYYAYYRNQVAYYTGRNLRLLSMLTAQVDGRVDMFSGFVKTYSSEEPPKDVAVRECRAQTGAPEPGSVRRGIEEGADGWRLSFDRAAKPADKPDAKALERVCATVPLSAILRPLVKRRVGTTFDALLVAKADGTVLYSIRPEGKASTLLAQEHSAEGEEEFEEKLPTETAVVVTNIAAIGKTSGWRKEEKPLAPNTLTSAAAQTNVTINGQDYIFFTEPYHYASSLTSIDGKPQDWIIGGLVSARRFRYDVTGVSINIVLIAVALALLAICGWPYLRIAFIHPAQALSVSDVLLIVICTITGAALLTLGVLDAIAYKRIVNDANAQLQRFGDGINEDFANDIERGTLVLDRIKQLTPTLQGSGTYGIPPSWRTDPVIARYPYIETVSWIDSAGMQQVKFAQDKSALVPVRNRRYFLDAKAGHTWTVKNRPYVLEWVRSTATGDVRAVLSTQTGNPNYPILALGTELIDITHAVVPPGVELAIINEDGSIVYHSDTQRIGYENFFVEADQNRTLRSAVLARRAESLRAPYWGEDQSMYVRPLAGSPWTLVAFRAKRLTRVLNVEGVLLTLMLLLLGATPYLMLYLSVLLLRPRYRAPNLWPDPNRWGDYLRLVVILIALMLFFYLNNWAMQPWSAFYGALFLPIIGILNVYLVLHRRNMPRRFSIAGALWIIAFALVICFLALGDTEARFVEGIAGNVLMIAAALLLAAITWIVIVWRGEPDKTPADRLRNRVYLFLRPRVRHATLYRLIGVLLLAGGIAQPTIAFFRISRHVERELLIKYSQLRAVTDLEHRIDHIARTSIAPRGTSDVAKDINYRRFVHVFGADWELYFGDKEPALTRDERLNETWTIPASAARWMPTLYDDSIAVRPLFSARSLDNLWRWHVENHGETIRLVRRILFDPNVARFVWGFPPPYQSIIIRSPLTDGALEAALERADREDGRRTEEARLENHEQLERVIAGNRRHYIAEFLVALMLLTVFWVASDFIARRVMLIDVDEPQWLAQLPLSPTLGDHIFLVRGDTMPEALSSRFPMGETLPFFDVSFEEMIPADGGSAMLEHLDSTQSGRNVRIIDFEYGISDGDTNEKKLQWLERLLALPDRTVIIVSTVSATFIQTTPMPKSGAPGYYDRWRALLDRFAWVSAEELQLRQNARKTQTQPKTWLDRETAYNPFLLRLRPELKGQSDPDLLLDEISERADTYYAGLWATCHDEEKLLLYHLAHHGLVNAQNRRVLRRLIARGLVHRDPNLRLFSETFRRYVIAAARGESLVTRCRATRGPSTWDALRVPFFVIIISFLLLLATTQKDLMTTTTALVTALTTGIPGLMKLISAVAERRADAPDRG